MTMITILFCTAFMPDKNNFFSCLINKLAVDVYVKMDMLDDDDMLSFFLGADVHDLTNELDNDTWQSIIMYFCHFIWNLKKHLMYIY